MTRGRHWRSYWSRSFRRNKAAVIGLSILVVVVIAAIFGPWLAPAPPDAQDLSLRLAPPSADSPLGRDAFGRDILSRVLIGSRSTLLAATGAVVLGASVGSLLGLVAGYRGGLLDSIVMRSMDLMLSFPYFLLAILVVAVAGPGLRNAAIAVAITSVPQYARVVRSATLTIKHQEFIEAARAAGLSNLRIVWSHVLPNVSAPIIVLSTVGMALSIIAVASLSFLGLGAQPPNPEWGAMLASGREFIVTAPHLTYFPGIAILLTVLGFNLMGDGLRDVLDPRLQ